ncbi:hypothetical protein F5878DRAFT_614064 [Lentinula raphanica]|uniref:Uncharacterized protein n=1 Tax=Lentinula raphanica TaxID=153919 RepID=A0AA38UIZ6_9AGAR|nr:hypothetical protein F5878DRAFT_614064 [Lentinula raphanica]
MYILVEGKRIDSYSFDFRLPFSLVSASLAHELFGRPDATDKIDLTVTIGRDAFHSYTSKIPFTVTSHVIKPSSVIFGSDFRDACERMGVSSDAPFSFSSAAGQPSIMSGEDGLSATLPKLSAYPAVWTDSPDAVFRPSPGTTQQMSSSSPSSSLSSSTATVPASTSTGRESSGGGGPSGAELLRDVFSQRFGTGIRLSPFCNDHARIDIDCFIASSSDRRLPQTKNSYMFYVCLWL